MYTDAAGLMYTACGPNTGPGTAFPNYPSGMFLMAPQQLAPWYNRLASARLGATNPSAGILIIGDSISEGYTASVLRNRWLDRVRRRLQGSTPGSTGFLPPAANLFSGLLDADWPGGDTPWSFTGAVSGNSSFGIGLHSANVPAAGTATVSFMGDGIILIYTRTTGGPTACAWSVDGVAQTPFNARGADAEGQVVSTGLTYGHHTLVVTPNDGPLVLEGIFPLDGDFNAFLGAVNSVSLYDGTHAGLSTPFWTGAPTAWTPLVNVVHVQFGLLIIALSVNDQGSLTADQYFANLLTLVSQFDANVTTQPTSVMFVLMPGTTSLTHVQAASRAAATVNAAASPGSYPFGRALVVDLASQRPGRVFGAELSTDGVHPSDPGQVWIADRLGPVLDPIPQTPIPTFGDPLTHTASQSPTSRVSWAANIITSGGATFDQSPSGTTQGERRLRTWLDTGSYQATIHYQQDVGLGTIEVLLARYVNATLTLTTFGSVATAGALANLSQLLGATLTVSAPGWGAIYVRKTTASGAVRFIQVVLDKL